MKKTISSSLVCLFFLAACSVPSKEVGAPLDWGLLGEWREAGGNKTLQFFREGTLIAREGSDATSSYYRIVDEFHIEIEPKYAPSTTLSKPTAKVLQATIRGNELTLTESGKSMKFLKID